MTAARTKRAPQLQVAVTAEHIDRAVPKDSGHCMIAEAVAAAFPDALRISVDLATIRFSDPRTGQRYIYLTPQRAQRALLDFDQGIKPLPFKFSVRAAQVVPIQKPPGEGGRRAPKTLEKPATVGAVPVVSGGKAPPLGALHMGRDATPARPAREEAQRARAGADARTGRRREFGLRGMG